MDIFNFFFDDDLLTKYRNAIINFENYRKKIYCSELLGEEHRGYLINLKDYEKLKETVFNNSNIFNSSRIFKINQIEFKTTNYLINMILNNNQYIFINTELWQTICNENKTNEKPIMYTIYKNDLFFSFGDSYLSFKPYKNIIDLKTINSQSINNNNFEQIKQINDVIIIYSNFEYKISNLLKNNNTSIHEGYLVSKIWIDNWKKLSNYEEIKNSQKNMMNYLIFYFEKNKANYDELMKIMKEMNVLKFDKSKDFEKYLEKDSLVLIDYNYIFYLNNYYSQKYMKYCAFNNEIHFFLEDNEKLSFISENNILASNNIIKEKIYMKKIINEKINNPNHLIQLIKIFYFHKNFNEIIKSSFTRANSNIFLINKNVMTIYKQIFNYKKLQDFLKGNRNTQNINYFNLENYYPQIISELVGDYINQIEKKKIVDEFNNIDDFIESEYKINEKINLKYIINFEIIDENIKNFFIKYHIAKEEHFIRCTYIADNGKILLIFNKNNNNFYEIGHFHDNGDFIIELLIDEIKKDNKNYIINYYLEKGLDNFIKYYAKEPQNIITINIISESLFFNLIEIKFFYCKIKMSQNKKILNSQNNNDNIINNKDDFKNNKFIKEIFSILLSIFTFEKKLKNSINESNNQHSAPIKNIVLLSSIFVNHFKNFILSFDKIVSFLEKLNINQDYNYEEVFDKFYNNEKGKEYFNLILNNEKKIRNYYNENKEYFFFEKKSFMTNQQQEIIYPDKFYISDETFFSKIMNILNKNYGSEEISFNLFFKHGKIVLKPNKNRTFNNYNNAFFLFLYSLRKENISFEINFIPEKILLFDKNENRINFLKEIINNEDEVFSYNNSILVEKYEFQSFLINENKAKELMKSQMKELAINNKISKYLSYLIIIYNENTKIKKEIKEKNLQSIPQEKEFYLINRKYMNELENILYFKEFTNNINMDIIKNLDFDINYNNNEIKNNLKDAFKDYITNYLLNIDEIKLKFDNENIFNLSKKEFVDKEKHKLYYYDDCKIINKKLYLLLNQIDKNLPIKVQLIDPILKDNKIFFSFNESIINIETLNEHNNTLIMEDIIYSESSKELLNIREIFKTRGYFEMKNYLYDKKIDIIINSYSSYINIYSFSRNKETNINKKYLSPKLKTLILLSFFEQNTTKYFKINKIEKVFLINKDWLIQYQYDKINSLIEKIDIKNYINNQNPLNLSIDSNQMNYIISLLDCEELLKIDEYISKLEYSNIPCESQLESLNFKDNKRVFIYNNFVMINEEISQIFNRNFSDKFDCEYITYTCHINGDIIIINKSPVYSILFGKINYKNFSFDIEFIFDFLISIYLEIELKNLMNKEIKEYLKEKTIFNDNNITDIISPIFGNNGFDGYCYKYFSKSNNKYDIDYFDYLSNDNLLKAIKLYFFYCEFSEKIKEIKYYEKEYYLINSNLMSEIKINYKYKQIKEILDTKNFSDKNKKDILAIKSLPNEIIKYFKESTIKNRYEKEIIEPNIIPIKDIKNEKEKSFMIYDKFEILEKEIVQNLIDEVYGFENNCLKCEINEGKIIIHYTNNFSGNDKYISVIGQLNYENHFLIEYILIYNDNIAQICHSLNIKGNLKNYLSSLQLYENSAPIVDENYKEIGTIIKYSNEVSNYNPDNLMTKGKEIINPINNNSIKEPLDSFNEKNENDINIYEGALYDKNNSKENKDEYNLDYETESHEIRDNFPFPPKIGLQNIGATCYMNATLQCFCHIGKFVNFFKYSQQVITIVKNDKSNLTSSFKLLIEKLWPNNYDESYSQKYYSPEEFKNKISKMNPLFEGIAANDAKDLVNFIIMTLHQELNKAKKVNTPRNIILDQSNPQIMFNNFASNFINENQSIISDLFYGINCNMTHCCICDSNIYNYQIYFFLVFPLEEVRKFKNNNQMNFINQPVNIYDCFDYDRKVNFMYGENAMYCNSCKQNANCQMCTTLTTGPEILILLLNRGHGIEFNVKIIFPEELNLFNYIEYKNTGVKYKLIGVITHIGESGMGGHFIAYCKDPISQSWYKYNDAIVSEVQDFQNEVINFAMPYLLFYQKN